MSKSSVLKPAVIVDDRDGYVKYLGNHWKQSTAKSTFDHTLSSLDASDVSEGPTLSDCLNASSVIASDIALYGTLSGDLKLQYIADSGNQSTVSLSLPKNSTGPVTGVELLRLNASSSLTRRSLAVFPATGTLNVDYLTYTATSDTNITNRDIILDDRDPRLKYTGAWEKGTAQMPTGAGYGGTMSSTNQTESLMTVQFIGSSIRVYGILNQVEGELIVAVTLDDTTNYIPIYDDTQPVDSSSWTFNAPFWDLRMAAGPHTLSIEVLRLDSVVYTSSVDNIAITGGGDTTWTTSSDKGGTIGTAVGVVVGLFFGCMLFVIVYKQWRRARAVQNASASQSAPQMAAATAATPSIPARTRGAPERVPAYDPEAGLNNPPPPYTPKPGEEERRRRL
ncbi:hypothetical protein D9613_009820 [Agrocybe pediades]|uniref:Uncharacterized protein n=1 Tax=Agrocybe pediades TaxID=84607 RepID=A0A8H4QY31_9AGAR|nr:hypothetical protein D9613_009820 [Agrocybe pediades]